MINQNFQDDTIVYNKIYQQHHKYRSILQDLQHQHLLLSTKLMKYEAIHRLFDYQVLGKQINDIAIAGEQIYEYLNMVQQDKQKKMEKQLDKGKGKEKIDVYNQNILNKRSHSRMSYEELQDKIQEINYQIQLQTIRKDTISQKWSTFTSHMNYLQTLKNQNTSKLRRKLQSNRQNLNHNQRIFSSLQKTMNQSPNLPKSDQYITLLKQDKLSEHLNQQNTDIIQLTLKITKLKQDLIPLLNKYDKYKIQDDLKTLQFNKYEGLKYIQSIQDLQRQESIINNELYQLQKQVNVYDGSYNFMVDNQSQNVEKEIKSQIRRYISEKRYQINDRKVRIDNLLRFVNKNEDESVRKQVQDILVKYQEIKGEERQL